MKKLIWIVIAICCTVPVSAQEKKDARTEPTKMTLTDIRTYMRAVQQNVTLYIQNYKDHSRENDVLYIINTTSKYIDSMQRSKETGDVLLRKHYPAIRNFFLKVTNKTSVSASFLYADEPFHFCTYSDSTTALYIAALKGGITYSAKDMTEKKMASTAFEDCILPSLKALGEFKEDAPRYFGFSIYYGSKDNKETTTGQQAIRAWCLTFVARFEDIRKYLDGYLTADDLVENAEVYLSGEEAPEDFRRIKITIE